MESELIEPNVFNFVDRRAKDVMVPMSRCGPVFLLKTVTMAMKFIRSKFHTRYPSSVEDKQYISSV